MAVEIFPRIAGVKVEDSWPQEPEGLVRCTVRLTRALTRSEAHRLRLSLDVDTTGNQIQYQCKPHEVEETQDRMARALMRIDQEPDQSQTASLSPFHGGSE